MRRKTGKLVRYDIDLANVPSLTAEQECELAALVALADDQIDTSDIPEAADGDGANAIRGAFYRPLKRQITTKVDADVLDWLQSSGKGYQSRINAILRREMLAALVAQRRARRD